MEKMDENTSFLFFLTSSRSLSASASSDTALSLSLRSLSHKVRIDSRSFTTWNHCCSNSSYWETHWWDCHCFCHWKEQIVFFFVNFLVVSPQCVQTFERLFYSVDFKNEKIIHRYCMTLTLPLWNCHCFCHSNEQILFLSDLIQCLNFAQIYEF